LAGRGGRFGEHLSARPNKHRNLDASPLAVSPKSADH
jgi:hypothetical protein